MLGLVKIAGAQTYADAPVDFAFGEVYTPFHKRPADSPEFRLLGISVSSLYELRSGSTLLPDTQLIYSSRYDRNGYRSGLLLPGEPYEESIKTRLRAGKPSKQVQHYTHVSYPKLVRSTIRWKLRRGRIVCRIDKGGLSAHGNPDNDSVRYERNRTTQIQRWRYARLCMPGEHYSSISKDVNRSKIPVAFLSSNVTVYNRKAQPLFHIRTPAANIDWRQSKPRLALDSAIRMIPENVCSWLLLGSLDEDAEPYGLSGQQPLPDMTQEEVTAFDSLVEAKVRFITTKDSSDQPLIGEFTAYEREPDGRLKRLVSIRNTGWQFELGTKDSFHYDSAGRILLWDSWTFRKSYKRYWSSDLDSLPLHDIWTFSYNPQGRVKSAEHRIWHSPPPALDSFYLKAIEYLDFEYNPNGTVAAFLRRRENYERAASHPFLEEAQRYIIRYSYFKKSR